MAKQLNVNLAFTADSKGAQQELQNLKQQLSALANTPLKLKGGISDEILKASNAAAELKVHLDQATNVKTGNLDFSKLSQSIKTSGSSLAEYGAQLRALGPAGNTAFQALAQSVAKAEIPIRRSNAMLTDMWTTLKNTARWQLSSSVLHGFMGAVQSAFGYAEDLNESLNNIRIVTGQNIEQMARFAEQANKAAKALSTTTTEYTNASLIYYQQGLSDNEVANRTEVTIKMANAAGESASKVSDQLTAVWNNFYDGSRSLEYYADVMTALGAATASSTDEISEGLNKFASVADTVGLSYEYAASALATVTATTRQSADVVGTAFKTLFARIQDLELGKTLDDGTTLGTYSQALEKVGVNIKDANGEMKAMDVILSEMAAKWTTLNKDQQVALAQSVAGVRQYTQLIALMDNWDFMESNLKTSYSATGTLDEQAEIYAQSWEAASKRVSAAAETIYSDLLNDEFIIDVLNGFEKFLTLIDKIIDSMGGFKGVLAGVSALLLKTFSSQVSQSLTNMAYNIQVMTKSGRTKIQNEQTAFITDAATSLNPSDENATVESMSRENSLKNQLQLQADMMTNAERMSAQEMEVNQMLLDRVRLMGEEVALKSKAVDLAKEEVASASVEARADAMQAAQVEAGYENRGTARKKGSADYTAASATLRDQVGAETAILDIINQVTTAGAMSTEQMKALESAIAQMDAASNGAFKELVADELDAVKNGENVELALREVAAAAKIVVDETGKKGLLNIGVKEENVDKLTASYRKQAKAVKENNDAVKAEEKVVGDLSNRITNARGAQKTWADTIVSSAQSISSLTMGLSSLGSIVDTLSNPDMSGWEKFTGVIMSLAMGIPMLISGLTGLNTALGITSVMQNSAAISAQLYLAAHQQKLALLTAEQQAELAANMSKATGLSLDQAQVQVSNAVAAAKLQEAAASGTLTAASTAEQIAGLAGITTDKAEIISKKLAAGATLEEAMAEAGLTATKTGGIAASVMQIYTKALESGARWANVVAIIAEQTAMSPLLVITLLLVAAMVALAAAIAVVVTVVNAIVNAYNADAIAAEKAEVAAKELAKAYDEARASYEEMVSAMEEYQSARDALDSLTKGTEEYSQALKEANRQALDLINIYDKYLNSDDYHWENGELIIDEGALKRAQAQKSAEVDAAYAASSMGAAHAKEMRAVSDQTNLKRSYYDGNIGTAALQAMGSSMAATLLPGLGTLLAPVLATASYATYAAKQGEEYVYGKGVDAAMELYREGNKNLFDSQENLTEALGEIGIKDEDLINALWENKDALQELGSKFDAAEMAGRAAAQENARTFIENSTYSNSKYAEEMTHMIGNKFYERQQELEEQYSESVKSKSGLKAAANSYFASSGIADQSGFKVEKYDKKNGVVKYSYLDDDGKRQEKEVTAQFIAAMQATTQVQSELTESCKVVSDSFAALDGQLGSTNAVLNEGMKAFLSTGDISQLTKDQYDEIAGMSNDELLTYLENIGINQDTVNAFGYDDMSAFIEALNVDGVGETWDQYQNITAHAGTENITLDAAENISGALEGIAEFFGEEVGHQMLDMSALMADSLDEAAQNEFWEQLGNISDYTDADQWDAFLEAMKDCEGVTDEQVKMLEEYVDTSKLAARATKDLNFDSMAESIRGLRDIMDSISEGNREISDEEFAALEAQGIDTSKFAKTIDGYRYLGESGDLVADISEGITNQFKEAEQNFANIAATAAQASQNLIDAEAELAAAKEAGDRARAAAEANADNQLSNTEKLSVIMSTIVNNVVSKIKAAWDWICGVMMDIYDFFARIFNTIGQGITDIWNGFLQIIEDIINGVVGGIVDLLEEIPGVDIDWDDVSFDKANFEGVKTTEEIEAEENAKKAEEDLIAATQDLANAIPDMVKSIESSADYLSEAELQAGQDKAQSDYDAAALQYEAAKNTYGADSTQANYYKGLMEYYEAQIDAYAKALDSKAWGEVIAEGIDTKEMESYIELLEQAHPEMRKLYDSTEEYEKALLQVATANKKMEKGVKSLSSNWDKWNDVMGDSNSSASDIATVLPDVNDALQDVLNLDTSEFAMLPPDFAQKHWNLIQDVVNGVEGSVDTLRDVAGQEILMTIDGVVDPNGNIDAEFLALHEKIAAFDQAQFTVGVAIDPEANADFIAACNDIIQKAGMTAEQAQAYFASMGYDVVLKPVKQQVTETVWNHVYRNLYDSQGNPAGRVIANAWPTTFTGEVDALAIETITPNGSYGGGIGVETTPPKTSRPNSSSSGGGNNNKAETEDTRDKTKKSDVVERYREVEDAIDNVTDALTRAEKATDRLWGKDKLNSMRKENEILKQQYDLLNEKAKQAKEYAEEDYATLMQAAGEAGISLTVDKATGDITNIESAMETLYGRLESAEDEYNRKVEAYNKAVAKANADGKVTDAESDSLESMKDSLDAYEKDVIGKIEKDIESVTDAEQQFKDSVETWEDAGLEAEDTLDQIMQNNFDIIMEGLEIPLSLNEEDIRLVELKLSQIEDDFYNMAEGLALTTGQFDEYRDNLRLADEAMAELDRSLAAGEITEAAYQEGLATIRDTYYDNIEALMELDKTMEEYYSNTLDMANEELSKYTDQMEHQTSVLEHYHSLIELMGKSSDYDMVGKVLEGQVKTSRDALDVSTEWYNKQRENADSLAAEYSAAQARGASEAELEIIRKNWEAAEASANEAQDKMLSDAEAWAESLKAVLENDLAKLGQTLENALTGGSSFDAMSQQWERAQSLQEEYLTTTNQIYETNKLMRTAQQEIDKTTNSAAKKRLKAYIEETEQLQNQSKLSQYELEIQQAKYDLLLAEMALEDAQDAKSTVRLQRDAEGNFGYVYTADTNKLAEAQQQLEDAQNSLYNIGLEGANDYAQKYQQTIQEMYDTYADIQQQKLDGAFETEEEYHRAMEEAKSYYYQKLQDYSGLYSTAVSADSRVVADAWSSDFASMVYDTDEWMQAVDEYAQGAIEAFQDWQSAVTGTNGVTTIVGGSVEEVGGKVQDVTDKSHQLAETTTKEVIPALDAELDAVQNMTGAYAAMRQEIQDVIEEYTNMVNRINNSQTNEWNSGGDDSGGGGSGDGNGGSGDGNGGSTGGGSGSGDGGSGGGTGDNSAETTELTWNRIMQAYDQIVAGKWGNGVENRVARGKDAGFTEEEVRAAQQYINYTFPRDRNGLGYSHDKAKGLMGFDTGGYTGDWAGSYGKLALLHKKELVLEPGDTENLLSSIEVLDHIIEMINLQSLSSQIGGLLSSPTFGYGGAAETLEQNVHIEASFPGVQDRNEIEEAFNNLINKASQYANRK